MRLTVDRLMASRTSETDFPSLRAGIRSGLAQPRTRVGATASRLASSL